MPTPKQRTPYPVHLLAVVALAASVSAAVTAADDRQLVPVEVSPLAPAPEYELVSLPASVVALRTSRLSPRVEGLVARLAVDEGDRVRAGDALVELDDELARIELARRQALVAEARARRRDAARRRDEAERLAASRHVSRSNLESARAELAAAEAALAAASAEARRASVVLERHRLRAPFAGVVARKLAEVGEWVDTSDPVLELVDDARVRIEVPVPQRYHARVSVGTPARLRFAALGGAAFEAPVSITVAVTDPQARSFPVLIELDNPDGAIAPGMSAQVELRLPLDRPRGWLVPADAVLVDADGKQSVWVVRQRDERLLAVRLPARTARAHRGRVEVLSPELEPGDRVVVRGNETLQPEQPVRIVEPR